MPGWGSGLARRDDVPLRNRDIVPALKLRLHPRFGNHHPETAFSHARVVELADTTVLEAVAERLTGSSPVPGTSGCADMENVLKRLISPLSAESDGSLNSPSLASRAAAIS
jgi:hypothetical protein